MAPRTTPPVAAAAPRMALGTESAATAAVTGCQRTCQVGLSKGPLTSIGTVFAHCFAGAGSTESASASV